MNAPLLANSAALATSAGNALPRDEAMTAPDSSRGPWLQDLVWVGLTVAKLKNLMAIASGPRDLPPRHALPAADGAERDSDERNAGLFSVRRAIFSQRGKLARGRCMGAAAAGAA